jgi:hypothetical protein
VSPADLFYMAFYVAIGWAMALAVLPGRLNLELWQWGTVGAIAIVAIIFAIFVTLSANPDSPDFATPPPPAPVTEQVNPTPPPAKTPQNVPGWVLWRMIAAAAFSLYIADMWFKYTATLPQDYESGSLLEVLFVFSGVLFAIGAALEYDVSSRSRRSSRRRTN